MVVVAFTESSRGAGHLYVFGPVRRIFFFFPRLDVKNSREQGSDMKIILT